MKILVKAKAGAKRESVEKLDEGTFVVAVKVRAEEGKANEAIERALAKHLGVPRSAVRIIKGFHSRQKVVDIVGIE